MTNFIRLHSFTDNTIILLNIQNIKAVDTAYSDEGKIYARVYADEIDDPILVNETAEKIYKMFSGISSINLIKLHETENNNVLILNIEDIVAILTTNDNGKSFAKIFTKTFDSGVEVNETPDKIYTMINEK